MNYLQGYQSVSGNGNSQRAENPTLVAKLNERMEKAYSKSLLLVVRETGLSKQMFPPVCPFNAEQLLSEGYWPG